MAVDAQVVIMMEPIVRDALDALAAEYRLSRSEVARRAVAVGLPTVVERLRAERELITRTASVGT